MTWNLIALILRALYQQELDDFLHEQASENISEPEHPESVSPAIDQKLLEPAYKVGDTVYLRKQPLPHFQNQPVRNPVAVPQRNSAIIHQ